jgi:Glutaredoxin-like domain (DUF836)
VKTLVLYSRAECHLCEELLQALEPLLQQQPATVRIVDIDQNAELVRRYGLRVPVLAGEGGEELSLFPLDVARVKRYLGHAAA